MSPLPSSVSAPMPSMIVRLSTCDATRNAMRLGKFALIRPVMHVHARTLRRENEVDADRARLLREHRERRLDLALHRHHEVRELVDDHDDVRQHRRRVYSRILERDVRRLRTLERRRPDDLAIEILNVAAPFAASSS